MTTETMSREHETIARYIMIDNAGRSRGQGISALSAFGDALHLGAEELRPYGATFESLGQLPEGWEVRAIDQWRIRNFTPHVLRLQPKPEGRVCGWPSEGSWRAVEMDKDAGDLRITPNTTGDPLTAHAVTRRYACTAEAPDDLRTGDLLVVSLVAAQSIRELSDPNKDAYTLVDVQRKINEWLRRLADAQIGVLVATPDTGPDGAIRDDEGRIWGTRRLVLVS